MDREILKKIPLFRGVSPEEAERMLGCLNAVRRRYEPEERILWAGQAAERLGAVLEGKVHDHPGRRGRRPDHSGRSGPRRVVCRGLRLCGRGDAACLGPGHDALRSPAYRTRSHCHRVRGHLRLSFPAVFANMLTVLADKNLFLNRRLGHLSKRSTRDKLLSYLEEQAAGRADEFAIPFTRAELADYLCVERSAMSTVLSRLRAEGLVETRGRRFRLHTHPR